MRTLIFALAAGGAVVAMQSAPAAAQTAQYFPWCAQLVEGNTQCTFTSERQCLEATSGEGGYCEENPGYVEGSAYASERYVKRQRRY